MSPAAAKITPAPTSDPPAVLNVRRLIWIRMIAVPGSALCLLLARQIYQLPIPALQLLLMQLVQSKGYGRQF